MDSSTWQILLFCVFLAISMMFSAAETSLMCLSKIKLRKMLDDGVKNADLIAGLLASPDKMLASILIGNNLVNIAASSVMADLSLKTFGNAGIAVATGISTFFILVFGEITPKTLARNKCEATSIWLAKPVYFVRFILTPAVFIFNSLSGLVMYFIGARGNQSTPTVTEDEIITMVNISHEEGVLEAEEKKMINNVFEFGDHDVGSIMTPRVNVVSVALTDQYNDIMKVVKESGYTRIPVYGDDAGDIVGVLNIKDIILTDHSNDEFSVEHFIRKPNFVYEFNNSAKVFSNMRKNNIPMSIVLDEYGIMAGVVTIEDFIEEIIGEITDEYDVDEITSQELNENEYLVDGSTSLGDFNELTGSDITSDNFDSIGGFVLGKLGDVPEQGQFVEYENMVFTVNSIENNRILSLHVRIS